jgi:hypothetical protein
MSQASTPGTFTMNRFMRLACAGASPEEVAALFEPGAYVLPTLWTQGKTPADILAYFQYFLVPGRCGQFRSMKTIPLGPKSELVTGLWDWWVGNPAEASPARYSAVVIRTPNGPRIAHLHSSLDPQA